MTTPTTLENLEVESLLLEKARLENRLHEIAIELDAFKVRCPTCLYRTLPGKPCAGCGTNALEEPSSTF